MTAVGGGPAMAAKITGSIPAGPGAKTGPIATDIDCDECGKPMVIREGRRGKFLGCSGYPKCKNTGDVPAGLLEQMGLNGNGSANGGAGSNGQHEEPEAASRLPEDEEIETDLSVE